MGAPPSFEVVHRRRGIRLLLSPGSRQWQGFEGANGNAWGLHDVSLSGLSALMLAHVCSKAALHLGDHAASAGLGQAFSLQRLPTLFQYAQTPFS